MGPSARRGRRRPSVLSSRLTGVVLPAFGIFLGLALAADVLLSLRGSDGGLGSTPPSPGDDGHPRAVLLGDSLLAEARPEVTRLLEGKLVETRFEGIPASGPLTPQGLWRGQLRRAVQEFNPDIVVIEACCHYDPASPYRLYGAAAVEADSEEMYTQWDLAMRELVAIAGDRGAHVFVVTIPDPDPNGPYGWLTRRISRLNEIYRRLGVDLVDLRARLQPDGRYTTTVAVGVTPLTVRAPDGLHLTGDGDFLASVVIWEAMEPVLTGGHRATPAS